MLEGRFYHSPRSQLTPLVRSAQVSLDARDRSLSTTDDDGESSSTAPMLNGLTPLRPSAKTPPASSTHLIPRLPRDGRDPGVIQTQLSRSVLAKDTGPREPLRKQSYSYNRHLRSSSRSSYFVSAPGIAAIKQIYSANQAYPAFYPPSYRRRKDKLLSQLPIPFSVPDIAVSNNCISMSHADTIDTDVYGAQASVGEVGSHPYTHRLLSLMLSQPACVRLLHFEMTTINDASSSSLTVMSTLPLDANAAARNYIPSENIAEWPTKTISVPQLSNQCPTTPSLVLFDESVAVLDISSNQPSSSAFSAPIAIHVDPPKTPANCLKSGQNPYPTASHDKELAQLFRALPASNNLPLRIGGVLLPGDAVLAVHPETHRVSSCTWYGNRRVVFIDGTQSSSVPIYRDATRRESAYSAERSLRHDSISDPFLLAALIFSAISNEIARSSRTQDYDIASLSELVIGPARHLLNPEEITRLEESLILALSAVKVGA